MQELLCEHKDQILARPFSELLEYIAELKKETNELKLERVSTKEVLADLSKNYGTVDHFTGY